MNTYKSYEVPEKAPDIVSDAIATSPVYDKDIKSLRHDLMDMVYETTDSAKLYTCLVFLKNNKVSQKEKMLKRLDELALLADGWDGADSYAINEGVIDIARRIIKQANDQTLAEWVLFPDARGYLYWDFTSGKDIAGITMASNQVVAFVKKNGSLIKHHFDRLAESDLLKVLEEVHG